MIVPYRGRFALRIVRLLLALACLAWLYETGSHDWLPLAALGAYVAFATALVFLKRFDFAPHSFVALGVDLLFLAGTQWIVKAEWAIALATALVLAHAVLLHSFYRVFAAAAVVVLLAALHASIAPSPDWAMLAMAMLVLAMALQKRFLESRLSHTMRHNVMIRSQAQEAAEVERERIAADFHDGPLQNFISFQMRLEIVRRYMERDISVANSELVQLQEIARNQIADLRGFVRSMRAVDQGLGLSASLSKMAEQFERDTGIVTRFSSSEFHDPSQTEISLEVLQIVREALNNIQRHARATRVDLSIAKQSNRLVLRTEDNGAGFPFAGRFSLDELELMHLGPLSIKRRIKLLGGNLSVDSNPGHGSIIEIQVPVRAGP